jgi:hypothetical protein
MKKISLLFAVAVAALGFSSCSETWDDNPVVKTHEGTVTAEFLNTPVMHSQPIMITADNSEGNFHLTCSQPDFGYAAVATYKVQMSLTEDFSTYEEISQAFYDCSAIDPMNSDVAAAIEKLSGVKTEADLPLPYQKIYVRLHAYIEQTEDNTTYLSNVVSYDAVAANYLAIWVEGAAVNIYLRGALNGWDALPEYQLVTGPEENTWVLNNVTIPGGSEFKIADSSWSSDMNLGSATADGTANKVVPNEPYALTCGDSAQNLTIADDFTGKVHLSLVKGVYKLTLDTNN